jgi:hypothetical protein
MEGVSFCLLVTGDRYRFVTRCKSNSSRSFEMQPANCNKNGGSIILLFLVTGDCYRFVTRCKSNSSRSFEMQPANCNSGAIMQKTRVRFGPTLQRSLLFHTVDPGCQRLPIFIDIAAPCSCPCGCVDASTRCTVRRRARITPGSAPPASSAPASRSHQTLEGNRPRGQHLGGDLQGMGE